MKVMEKIPKNLEKISRTFKHGRDIASRVLRTFYENFIIEERAKITDYGTCYILSYKLGANKEKLFVFKFDKDFILKEGLIYTFKNDILINQVKI